MEENKRPVSVGSTPEWNPQNNKSDNGNKGLKVTVIVLAVVAVVLAAVFAYVWIDRQKMINDLTVDKQNLTNELIELQGEYAQLSSNNDSLNVQLDASVRRSASCSTASRRPMPPTAARSVSTRRSSEPSALS